MVHIKRLVMHGFKSFARRTEIVFDKGINVVLGPNGSGKSCSYDTLVTLSDGNEIEIGKLVEEQISKSAQIKTLKDGIYTDGDGEFEIISLNKDSMKSENKKISKFIKREGEEIYKIKTRSGKELKATGCHPVMSFVNGKVQSQLIRDLGEGSAIASPRHINIEGKPICSPDFARLMGYIIGDGYIAKDRIEFVNADEEIIADYKEIIIKMGIDYRERIDKGVKRIYIREKKFVENIRELFYKNYSESITSAVKKIPLNLLNGNREVISNILAGMYDTDGSIRKDIEVIEYCTKNINLANQIQGLLLRFGIQSKIKSRLCCATNTENKTKREYRYIYIYGHENIKKFNENIKLKCTHKSNTLLNHIYKEKKENSNVDLLPKEINCYVKRLVGLLGIDLKPLREEYPALTAYADNRCSPTRNGIVNALRLFEQKYSILTERYNSLKIEPLFLIDTMDDLSLSSQNVAEKIGLHSTIIRNQWGKQLFNPRPENLQNFYSFIKENLELRIEKALEIINLLKSISTSDIYWDEIVSIEKLPKEKYVYDLTIEDNHNFIANNIFVHNSNISDALCFVLGRLSIKSMRAAKAKNLLFMGSKYIKPAREASVELVFDNKDRTFGIDKDEISLKRIVRYNGQGIYKINDETKTRIEVIEMLAQAGIDPYGFNLILQGQIQAIVKMHPEDRRKIIEEVAGIAIYESRKEKALKELEKTEERFKEIAAILREKTAYLKNLDKERSQALRFKEIELMVKRLRASIFSKRLHEKQKEISHLQNSVNEKDEQRNKLKQKSFNSQENINKFNQRIEQISKYIQQATGLEQESLHLAISNLKAEIEGIRVRIENYQNRSSEIERRIKEMQLSIPSLESEIRELRNESPLMAQKTHELKRKKEELANLEEERKNVNSLKNELLNTREKIKDRERQIGRIQAECEGIIKNLEEYSAGFTYHNENECEKNIHDFRKHLHDKKSELDKLTAYILENEKNVSVSESEIMRAKKIQLEVEKIDICPLCQNKITENHVKHVREEQEELVNKNKEIFERAKNEIRVLSEKRQNDILMLRELEDKISKAEIEKIRHRAVKEKNDLLKMRVEEEKQIRQELQKLEERRKVLEDKASHTYSIEERYEEKLLEIEEISSRTSENVDTTLMFKEREIEKLQGAIKISQKDLKDLGVTIYELNNSLNSKSNMLETKEVQEDELQKKFKKLFEEREEVQKNIQEENFSLSGINNDLKALEDQINYLKVGGARLDAEREAIDMELIDYVGLELVQGSIENLNERLQKNQQSLQEIGSINLRAMDVFDDVKKEYDLVYEKVQILEKEKQDIMGIITEIDMKKRRSFVRTFKAMSDLFSQNFSKLYTKGVAFLELENKEDIFSGGVNIIVRLAKGKYFDVTSLSGGEQTLVALSLLFAIQEYKPYHFYIFDEIDAALDKRNSERLAALLNQYMKDGQYIVITHNDAIIMNAQVLYGVSMHDGVSKILSLDIKESLKQIKEQESISQNPQINVTINDSAPLNTETLEENQTKEEEF